jgi:hypothetical protein
MINQKVKGVFAFVGFSLGTILCTWGILLAAFYVILEGCGSCLDWQTGNLLFILAFCFYIKAIISVWMEFKA